jgi:Ras-related protein Rab-2A
MQYVETSAKSGENVERAFLEVAERIYQNIEAGKYDLNDRRSGVKGPGAGGGAGGKTVQLGKKDGNAAKKAGIAGGCC